MDISAEKRRFFSRRCTCITLLWTNFILVIFMTYCLFTFEWMSVLPSISYSSTTTTRDDNASLSILFPSTNTPDDTEDAARSKVYDVPLIVHYVLLHKTPAPKSPTNSVTFSACLSLLSVIKNLQPSSIYIHTNYPDFWPFDSCADVIKRWSPVKFILTTRTFVTNGTKINRIEHEADIVKFKAVEEYGGLVLDFDVYIIDGEGIREWLVENPCIVCHEGKEVAGEGNKPRINAGFFGCLHKHARFPQLILKESYEQDFHPNEWIWNSGITPLRILEEHPETAVLVDDICNNPAWLHRSGFNLERGRYNWTDRKAFHSYYKDSSFGSKQLKSLNSTLGDMLRWILYGTVPNQNNLIDATNSILLNSTLPYATRQRIGQISEYSKYLESTVAPVMRNLLAEGALIL